MRLTAWSIVLIVMLLCVLVGQLFRSVGRDSTITAKLDRSSGEGRTLFVWVHGFDPSPRAIEVVADTLRTYGDVLTIEYPAGLRSRAEAGPISKAIRERVREHFQRGSYGQVVVVAYSVGALLARRALVDELNAGESWAKAVRRVVLLAGMNRGWNSRAEKPADLAWTEALKWYVGEWFAELTGRFDFLLQFRAGSPFVADLRIDWMKEVRELHRNGAIEVVQLLGDIDNVVSVQDSQDLRAMASELYAFLRVRGTGHGDILDFDDPDIGQHRRQKLVLAATRPFKDLKAQSEEQPFTRDDNIHTVVFVLHGIRDLGRWSSIFEDTIRDRGLDGVRIVSPRYGYLGMGPFLLPGVRDKHVRWLMDEYTETLARYWKVGPTGIRFFGHSNGTYLLADALKQYRSMKVDRVALAGSVVPTDYDWKKRVEQGQVSRVRNYVGTTDWVVALFPRLFEYRPVKWFGNDLGGAGYEGFEFNGLVDAPGCPNRQPGGPAAFENVCFIQGAHSAYDQRIPEIIAYLLDDNPTAAKMDERSSSARFWLSAAGMWMVWLLLVVGVVYVGARVVSSAPSPASVVVIVYVLLVIRTLQTL